MIERTVVLVTAGLCVLASILAGCMPTFEVVESGSDRRACLNPPGGPEIRWFSPVERGENRELAEWCANVGPPVVRAGPTAEFSGLPSDSIDVLVWNVEAGDGWVTKFLKENAGLTCAGPNSSLESGRLHFVLLAQEALRRSNEIPEPVVGGALLPRVGGANMHPGALLDILQVAEQCGLSVFYLPGSRNGADEYAGLREDKGNAILSTLPLSDLAGIELPFESIRRVVPVATITTAAGKSVRLTSVHFITTPPPWRVVMTGNSARERQALGLIDGLMRVEATFGDLAVVVAGDLNTFSHREASMRRLRAYLPDSPPPLKEPTRGPIHADHIMFRGNTFFDIAPEHIIPGTYERIDEVYYSDHYPVRARLRLGR